MNSKIKMIINKIKEKKYLLFLIFTIWVGLEYIGAGPFSYIRIHDTGDSTIPLYLSFAKNIFKYGMTYWNQYAVCGIDRFANGPDILHLNTLLFLIFPGWIAYQILVLGQLFIASYFTYRLCRDVLKLEEIPSIYAGIFFSLFFDELICFSLGIASFPLLLWGMEVIYTGKQKTKYLYIIILGALYSLSSSFAGVLPFTLPLALLWFIFVRRKYSIKFLIFFAILCFSTAIWYIPTILALLKNAPLSHRAFRIRPDSSMTLNSLLIYFSVIRRHLMIYWSKLIFISLAVIGIYYSKLKDRNFITVLSLLIVCAIIGPLTKPLSPYIDKLFPFLHGFNADRVYLLAPFFWAIVGAYGLHFIPKDLILIKKNAMGEDTSKKKWKLQSVLGIIIICFLICNTFIVKKDNAFRWLTGGNYFSNYQNQDLEKLASISNDSPFRVATIAYRLHPAYANAYGLESVDGYVVVYPKTYQDFWGKVIEPLTLQNKEKYHYFHDWGNRVYLFEDDNFSDLDEIVFSDYYNLDLLSLVNAKYIISAIPLVNENLTLLLSSPRNTQTYNELSTIEKGIRLVKENFQGRELYIYKNENSLPRFFLVNQIKVFENSTQLLDALSEVNIKYLKNNLLIEKEFTQNLKNYDLKNSSGEVTVKHYSPDKIVLSVDLNGPMILAVSNNYSPYWKCKVDGEETEIFPAYHTFWGVLLEGNGTKEVVFEYCPPYRFFKRND